MISSDGSTVAYDSLASNLDSKVSSLEEYENYQVYASTLDYTNDTVSSTTLVSVDTAGNSGGDGTSIAPSLSDNGQMVAFQSASDNLVDIPNGGSYNDVYVRDLTTNTTKLVSIADTGQTTGGNSSFAPQMSGDGDYVLFYSLADDLTSTPLNAQTNVFDRNLTTGTTVLVSYDYQNTAGANDTSTLANQTLTESCSRQPDRSATTASTWFSAASPLTWCRTSSRKTVVPPTALTFTCAIWQRERPLSSRTPLTRRRLAAPASPSTPT